MSSKKDNFVKKYVYNAKAKYIDGKAPRITNLATNAALNVVKNKKSNVCNLLKKAD